MTVLAFGVQAQRFTDKLNRGLVAVPQGDKTGQDGTYGMSGTGMFVCWRILPAEYYDTKYNLYRGTTLIAENLTVSNYQDNEGTATSVYKVVPVVRGVERTDQAATCTPWEHQFWAIPVQPVVNRAGNVVSGYSLNDCSVADVDGDGQMEFVVKRRNDSGNLLNADNTTDFNRHECYKMDGTLLWSIDMGPNLMAGPDEQFDLILYDWDQDGKAEALMRGADNMIIHTATKGDIQIGNMNYYAPRDEYTKAGAEYLLYIDGATGVPYAWDGNANWTPQAYPLPRFESGESDYAAVWGSNDTGHRATKHYFGAPYLDGRNPSIFLGRGCYTRHKFCALDVNKETHELTQRWRWNCYDGKSPWFGNGFHNYAIADVDMDGRDEIVFGSMIIDDTGYGLSTTGFGHGDAQHCGDLDPYRWGLEQFVCLEGSTVPGIAYTDATSSTLRYTTGGGSDNGRCLAGNFYNSYPGAVGMDGGTRISLVADKVIDPLTAGWNDDLLNARVYWDGDLLDEFMDSPGVERAPTVYKAPGQAEVGTGRTYTNNRCWMGQGNLNNSSKNNACFLGDIIGDWREEIVTRTADKLIIQISSYPSPWGITTLWADHEYRNAMTWQSVGYNQPPHTSFFLGELENITNCPPAITLEGRTEVQNGGTIATTDDQLLVSGYENKTISVQDGASPAVLFVNAPAWVKGSGSQQATASTPKQPERTVETFTTTLTGGAFSGATRLVKQGEGVLVLPNVVEKHTGNTDIWNGTLQFDGTFESSTLWLNRHTTLISNGGQFLGGLKADYNATIYPGGKNQVGNITATTLTLGFGSRLVFDCSATGFDQVNASTIVVENKTWQYGPKYKAPVIEFVGLDQLASDEYVLGQVGAVTGRLAEIVIEGMPTNRRATLKHENGQLKVVVEDMRAPATVQWNGTIMNATWQQGVSENFLLDEATVFSTDGDDVLFSDDAKWKTVTVKGAVSPRSITFDNTKTYTINGDSIVGGASIIKNGTGLVKINNTNNTGTTTINGGAIQVTLLANNSGQTYGALGNASQPIYINNGGELQVNGTIITDQVLNLQDSITINVLDGKSIIVNKSIKGSGATLYKTGTGSLEMGTTNNRFGTLVIKAGTVRSNYSSGFVDMLPATVQFMGGTLWGANKEDGNGVTNTANFVVPEGKTGKFYGSFRGSYTGKLTGAGTFYAYTGGIRCYWDGDWSAFTGTVYAGKENRQNKKTYDPVWAYRNTKGLPNATLNVLSEVTVSNEGLNIPIGKVAGAGTLTGTGSWILGTSNADFSIPTAMAITSKVTKRGTGKMTIPSVGLITGVLNVEEGTVAFYSAAMSSQFFGANKVTVKGSGRLVGQGLLYLVDVQSGAELMPCASTANETTPGTIKAFGLLNAYSGSTIHFLKGATANSTLECQQNITVNGTVKVTLLDDYTPAVGDAITLWTAGGTFSGTPTFDLPALPAGLYWDTREVAQSTGVLRITDDATVGIRGMQRADAADRIYDLRGRLVKTGTTDGLPAGLYIRNGKVIVVR